MSAKSVPSQGCDDWETSSYSNDGDACVGVSLGKARAAVPGALVRARDTKQMGLGPVLAFPPASWTGFVDKVKEPGSPLAGGF